VRLKEIKETIYSEVEDELKKGFWGGGI